MEKMQKSIRTFIIIPLVLIWVISPIKKETSSMHTSSKIDLSIFEQSNQAEIEFLIAMKEHADLSNANNYTTKTNKGYFVYQTLSRTAKESQQSLINFLDKRGVEFRSYWIVNAVWAKGDFELIEEIAQRSDVAHIYANPKVRLDFPEQISPEMKPNFFAQEPTDMHAIGWNIERVNAPEVWEAGYTGQGAVIGGQDTGYDWDHPALINQYRGWDGSAADHNYHWHDAIHSGGGVCGPDSLEPCDDWGHGTHTMGTMVGDDGLGNQIGMAPGARWIGCRNMDQGFGTPATYIECYQWFIAPTNLDGEKPNPDLAPHVINNSWGCPAIEGCTDPSVLLEAVKNVNYAGIVTVHSAGNSGSACATIDTPAAIYDESFTVGNTDNDDYIASNSSRGPVTVDGSNRIKPDISAPGTNILSSIPGGNYSSKSGTSMAAPHVAGLVALLISANPSLAGNVDQIESLITQNALARTATQTCEGVPGTQIPNNTYGWGRIDAEKSVAAAFPYQLQIQKNTPSNSGYYVPGVPLRFTITVTNTNPFSATNHLIITDSLPIHTDFFSATTPYTLSDDQIQWELDHLNGTASYELIVLPPSTYTDTILNEYYGVRSDEFSTQMGCAVSLEAYPYSMILPFINKESE
jgi:serine protease AprX